MACGFAHCKPLERLAYISYETKWLREKEFPFTLYATD
jgi:hypothetical protein